MSKPEFQVEVVFATPKRQRSEMSLVTAGATVADAIAATSLPQQFPEMDLAHNPVGIFSRRCEPTTKVKPGDRVEVYRPLPQDPNRQRQARCK